MLLFSLPFLSVINRNKLQSGWEWAGSGNGTPQRSRAWMCVAKHMDMAWMQDLPVPWASAYKGIYVHSAHASMPAEVCLIYLGASGVEQSACNVPGQATRMHLLALAGAAAHSDRGHHSCTSLADEAHNGAGDLNSKQNLLAAQRRLQVCW